MSKIFGERSLGQRECQEDAFEIVMQSERDPNGDILLLVADGMGGHVGGEVASNLAISQFIEHFVAKSTEPVPRLRLVEALRVANAALASRIAQEPKLKGMGCTFIGALKLNDQLVWASVGDSLLYLYRKGRLKRLNADHSLYGELLEMVAEGKITQSEADKHPKRNSLRSAVTGEPLSLIDVNTALLEPGDIIVLASDGLDTLQNGQIAEILQNNRGSDASDTAMALLSEVEQVNKPNQDNTTVVVYQHDNGESTGFHSDSKWKLPTHESRFGTLGTVLLTLAGVALVGVLGFVAYMLMGEPEPVTMPENTEKPSISTSQDIGNGAGGEIIETPKTDDGVSAPPEGDALNSVEDENKASENSEPSPDQVDGQTEGENGEINNSTGINDDKVKTDISVQDPKQDVIVDR